jgi:hypothetical protein
MHSGNQMILTNCYPSSMISEKQLIRTIRHIMTNVLALECQPQSLCFVVANLTEKQKTQNQIMPHIRNVKVFEEIMEVVSWNKKETS